MSGGNKFFNNILSILLFNIPESPKINNGNAYLSIITHRCLSIRSFTRL